MESFIPIVENRTITLPSSGKNIKIRPLLIREEKILLMVKDSENNSEWFDAIEQVVENCIVSDINLKELIWLDFSYVYLQLRKISVGETCNMSLRCDNTEFKQGEEVIKCLGVEKPTIESFHIDNITKIINNDKKKSKIVMVTKELGVELKYTTTEYIKTSMADKSNKLDNYNYVASHIVAILKGEERFSDLNSVQINDFIDNLQKDQFKKLLEWFNHEPVLVIEIKWKCPHCKKDNVVKEVNILDFFAL